MAQSNQDRKKWENKWRRQWQPRINNWSQRRFDTVGLFSNMPLKDYYLSSLIHTACWFRFFSSKKPTKWKICMRKSITNPFTLSLIANKINSEHLTDKIIAYKLLMHENRNSVFVYRVGDVRWCWNDATKYVYWWRYLRATNVQPFSSVCVCVRAISSLIRDWTANRVLISLIFSRSRLIWILLMITSNI